MRALRGFTLIELMIAMAVIAILAAVGYPSYQRHIARGQRSLGQQVLSDIAQRQEQYLLDRRQYATVFGAGTGGLGLTLPSGIKYDAPDFTGVNNGTTPPTFTICLAPTAGSVLASRGDGSLCINSQGQQWREEDANATFNSGTDCAWTDTACRLAHETS